MKIDFTPYFNKYVALVAQVEKAVNQVRKKYPDEVKCKKTCSDCCYALFDLTFIEALYVNTRFNETFIGNKKNELLEKANKSDRKIYKIKRDAYRATRDGKAEEAVIEEISQKRIRCPLLGENDLCQMYEYRPIACRAYGIPLAIGGKGRTCGLSDFKAGEQYPTLNLDIVQNQLMAISSELVRDIKSRHLRMSEILVPLSMALITEYNEEYLGIEAEETSIGSPETGKQKKGGENE